MTNEKTDARPKGLVLTRDLLFSTKITGTARALGFEMDVVANVEGLARRMSETAYRCLLLDLSVADVSIAEVMQAVGENKPDRPAIVAFGSHVDTARLAEAESAGCNEVMPRSRFAGTLPDLLGRLLSD